MAMGTGGALGAQLAGLRMLPEVVSKEHPRTTQCSVCGKVIRLKEAIFRDDKVFCEECFKKNFGT